MPSPTAVRRVLYKDLLQPALHRRFSTTATILLAVAYVQAAVLTNWSSIFWTLFPIGPTGIRTFFLALCGLSIIILRIAQYHVGLRTSTSALSTFIHHAIKIQTAEAVLTYVFSAWLFSQIYVWSFRRDSGLAWLVHFAEGRTRLNEKALFLTSTLIMLGICHACVHLIKDVDRLSLGYALPPGQVSKKDQSNGRNGKRNDNKSGNNNSSENQYKCFFDQLPDLSLQTFHECALCLVLSTFVYQVFLRDMLWQLSIALWRPFVTLPKSSILPSTMPFTFWTLTRCFVASYSLLWTWKVGNVAFSVFLVREPLKNRKPLSSGSKDPNGSLLNGLKSKKLTIQCFAMWELAFIARDFKERRKAIYQDIDRMGGPIWSQLYAICIGLLKSIETRIDGELAPPAPKMPAESAKRDSREFPKKTFPPQDGTIYQTAPKRPPIREGIEHAVGQLVLSPGRESTVRPIAKWFMDSMRGKKNHAQKARGTDGPQSLTHDWALGFLGSPFGWPLRQEYARRITAVVFGRPYGEPSLYVNAVAAVSQLSEHSLMEDRYGNVQRDVKEIINLYTKLVTKLRLLKDHTPRHWTDVWNERWTPEVDLLIETLKNGLRGLIEAFGEYAKDLKLTATEIRHAKEAAGLLECAGVSFEHAGRGLLN